MTSTNTYAIKKIYQKDNTSFTIEWSDGEIRNYRLSDLQKQCPCAQCMDEFTGKRKVNELDIDPNVRAKRLTNVGRYALRIEFTSGCSVGIYAFDTLRESL